MRPLIGHRRGYHDWRNSTPLLDVTRVLVGAASLMIGLWAVIFAALAARDGETDQVIEYGLYMLGVAVANGAVEFAIRWRRHHG
jgi:hypothetical protein